MMMIMKMKINHPIEELMMHVQDCDSLSIQHSREYRVRRRREEEEEEEEEKRKGPRRAKERERDE